MPAYQPLNTLILTLTTFLFKTTTAKAHRLMDMPSLTTYVERRVLTPMPLILLDLLASVLSSKLLQAVHASPSPMLLPTPLPLERSTVHPQSKVSISPTS